MTPRFTVISVSWWNSERYVHFSLWYKHTWSSYSCPWEPTEYLMCIAQCLFPPSDSGSTVNNCASRALLWQIHDQYETIFKTENINFIENDCYSLAKCLTWNLIYYLSRLYYCYLARNLRFNKGNNIVL